MTKRCIEIKQVYAKSFLIKEHPCGRKLCNDSHCAFSRIYEVNKTMPEFFKYV
jgi:hypothetical protein